MRYRLLPLLLLLAACGSSSSTTSTKQPETPRPATVARPDINAELVGNLFFGSQSTTAATVDVVVTNRADQPITIRRIEMDTPAMTQYRLRPARREFKDTIAPGETKRLPVFATAERFVSNRLTEPLTIRVLVEVEAGEARWRELVTSLNNRAPF